MTKRETIAHFLELFPELKDILPTDMRKVSTGHVMLGPKEPTFGLETLKTTIYARILDHEQLMQGNLHWIGKSFTVASWQEIGEHLKRHQYDHTILIINDCRDHAHKPPREYREVYLRQV